MDSQHGIDQDAPDTNDPAGSTGTRLPRIGLVLDSFPATSETFVLREVQQLAADGVPLTLAAFRRPAAVLHRDAVELVEKTHYRPDPRSLAFWRAAVPEMLRLPFWFSALRIFVLALTSALEEMARRALRLAQPSDGDGAQPGLSPGAVVTEIGSALYSLAHLLPTGAWAAGVFRRAGVEHVHAHFLGAPAVVGQVAARLLGSSFSISVHGSDLFRFDLFHRGNVSAAHFVLTCTSRSERLLREQYSRPGSEHVHRVYHGLNLDQYRPLEKPFEEERSERPPTLVCVGRLVPKKGIDLLLSACERLREAGIDFRCEIIGDGPEREALQEQARRGGIRDAVLFRGACSQEEVLQTYHRGTLLALPCRVARDGDRDGIPNVLVEALAVGLPVITTPVGAVTELIEPGVTGVLAAPENAGALADAILRLLADPAERERLAREGRRRVEREFDLGKDPTLAVFLEELSTKD